MQDVNICVIGYNFIGMSGPAADKIYWGGIHDPIVG